MLLLISRRETPSPRVSVIDLGALPGSYDSDAEGIIAAVIDSCLLGNGLVTRACFGVSIYGVVQCRPCSLVQTQGPDISAVHGWGGDAA